MRAGAARGSGLQKRAAADPERGGARGATGGAGARLQGRRTAAPAARADAAAAGAARQLTQVS